MPEIVIRIATAADFEQVANLLAELGRPEVTPETRAATREVFERTLARPDASPLVAEVDGLVVGFMSLEFRERLNHVRRQAWIPDLIVTAGARRVGAGRALLQRGFELAAERGCWSVTLESGYARQAAHELYRTAGMTEDGYYFTLRFDVEPK